MDKPTELPWTGRGKLAGYFGGMTPVPNGLLDRVMPTLRDTELRVLLVIVRQTLGWQDGPDPSQRKERDWLTQSHLMHRTGRASGAVSRAVDALVRGGLIDVLDRMGGLLKTPAERRRHLGRLYYRLTSPAESEGSSNGLCKREYAKAHTTKETVTQKYRAGRRIVDKPVDKPFVIRSNRWTRVSDVDRHTGE